MRRFDRQVTESGVERHAVESLYSFTGQTVPGAHMPHTVALESLVAL